MAITYHAGRRIQGISTDRTGIESSQGYAGGDCSANAKAGGGGAGAVGNPQASGNVGGNGGNGLASSISGSSVTRAGGGGGASWSSSTNSAGGTGGGGIGSQNTGTAGTVNTGSGGGGGGEYGGSCNNAGGNGGSGIVILRFTTSGNGYDTPTGTHSVATDGSYTVISWTAGSGTFTPTSAYDVEYLVIAGGGGGGGGLGGGGGAGGYRTATGHAVTAQAYTITVGAGGSGAPASNSNGSSGGNSVFDTITSTGGGYGSGEGQGNGGAGGSGGGAGGNGSSGGTAVTYVSTPVTIPANAQVGSRFEETDTRKMYNYTEGLQFEDNFSDFTADTTVDGTEVNGWTPNDASQAWIDEGTNALQFNQTNESSNNAIVFDMQSSYGMGTNVSDTKWRLDYTSNLSSFSGTQNQSRHWFGLASGAEDIGLQTAQDAIWIHCSPHGSDWGVDTSDNAVAPQATGTSLTFATSTDYFWSLIRDGDTVTAYRWTDGTRTSAAQTSTQDISAKTITNLRYIKYSNRNQTSVGGVAGAIKDISFYNGVTDTTSNVWKEIGT